MKRVDLVKAVEALSCVARSVDWRVDWPCGWAVDMGLFSRVNA